MDSTKIKSFFVNHFEKMVFAGVVGASGFLIFQGLGLEHFTDEFDPARTTDRARQVNREIDEDRTEAIVEPRIPTLDVRNRTGDIATAVNPAPYAPAKAWEPPGSRKIVRRKDPEIMPPRALVMTTFVGSIGWQNISSDESDDYPLAGLPGADAIDDDSKPTPRPNRRPGARRGAEEDDDDDGGFGFDRRAPGRDEDEPVVSRGAGRTFDADTDFGATARNTNGHPPIPKLARFIAGSLVVPHKEIYEAYELALGDADSYLPRRDVPIYVNFEVQRADVTRKSPDQLADEDWVRVWTRNHYEQVAWKRWAGVAKDIVPPEYRDERLSNWIPPILLDRYRSFVTHPLIPMVSPDELETEEELEEVDPSDDTLFAGDEGRSAPRAQRGGFGNTRRGGFDNARSGRVNRGGFGAGRGTSRGSADQEEDPVDYKLIRFYDFHNVNFDRKLLPKPGAKYIYRVRYAVEDPNFPAEESEAPKLNSLAPEVEQRVLKLANQYQRTRKRQFERWSPWSEPSDPISLPSLSQQFAGPITPGSYYDWTVAGKTVRYQRSRPSAKVVAAQFDEAYGTRVPFLLDVNEGSVLSQQGAADVVDPITMEIKKLEDALVENSTAVIDLAGGLPLGLIEGMNQPGMMLMTDDQGNLIVSDEVGDLEPFRIYSFADERDE